MGNEVSLTLSLQNTCFNTTSSGVEGHFAHPHDRNWKDLAYKAGKAIAMLTGTPLYGTDPLYDLLFYSPGAKESEVITMSTLTANLHLMISTFYKPSGSRYKILCESKAFPSDQVGMRRDHIPSLLTPLLVCFCLANSSSWV